MALERNSDLQRQVLLTLSAEQDKIIARSAILPSLTLTNASLTRTRTNGPIILQPGATVSNCPDPTVPCSSNQSSYSTNYAASVRLTQLIFDGGRWWNNMSAADLGLQSNQAQ